jgi:selenocysteine-specific elongation factor
MRVIGTAGHIDHGKSTLVEALTGMNPDRLKEEQARQMTIDLGFAWLTLLGGEEIGIVDVPGHRDFIENMLAGIGGIDAALFVIAADEGVMPQTKEHLAILNLLEIPVAATVLTKIDLIRDREWLAMVEEEIHQFSRGTVLEKAPLLPVSAKTGAGIEDLKQLLDKKLLEIPRRRSTGVPRLPVDRVFSMVGYGTVVTGTLLDGDFKIGQEVQVYPGDFVAKIRGLQTHKRREDTALVGSRTAINLSGVDARSIKRGDVLSFPGKFTATRLIDAKVSLLDDASSSLQHHMEVKLFLGTNEVLARVKVLGKESIKPGDTGWIQLDLQSAVIAVKGDRFILRKPSPAETIGGGVLVDPLPLGRHKRFDEKVTDQLEQTLKGNPEDTLLYTCYLKGAVLWRDLSYLPGGENENWLKIANKLITEGKLLILEQNLTEIRNETLIATLTWIEETTEKCKIELTEYHKKYPYRMGMPREALKSKSGLNGTVFNALLKRWLSLKVFKEQKMCLSLFEFTPYFERKQQNQVDELLRQFAAAPFSPPTVKFCLEAVGMELYRALLENEILIEVSPEVVFRGQDFEDMLMFVKTVAVSENGLTIAQFRDHFDTSRRYALAFLEYLDLNGVTLRDGDFRRLKNKIDHQA